MGIACFAKFLRIAAFSVGNNNLKDKYKAAVDSEAVLAYKYGDHIVALLFIDCRHMGLDELRLPPDINMQLSCLDWFNGADLPTSRNAWMDYFWFFLVRCLGAVICIV